MFQKLKIYLCNINIRRFIYFLIGEEIKDTNYKFSQAALMIAN